VNINCYAIMKAILISIIFLVISINCSAQLTLKLSGIESSQGVIYIGLYNQELGFTEIDKTFMNWIVPAKKGQQLVELKDIPNGQYAISIFHDTNNNGILDKNFLGIPNEIYGFSNNARAILSAPTFAECTFTYNSNLDMEIELK